MIKIHITVLQGEQQLNWPSGGSVRLWSFRLGFDSESGQTNTLKLVFTASLLDAQHERDGVKNKTAKALVTVEKAFVGISQFWCGRQVAGNS